MDSTLLEATIWSWAEGEPHAHFSSPRAAVAHQTTGRSVARNEKELKYGVHNIHSLYIGTVRAYSP